MAGGLHHLTITEAVQLIARRELSPVELTEACLRRIEALGGQLAAFITVTAERAMRAARTAEREIVASGSRGALHGIPYCLKDVFDVAGVRTTAGSRLLADHIAGRDSACAERLEAAGAVLLGKTTTWEFAHGGPSWDVPFPQRAIPGTPSTHWSDPPPALPWRSRPGWRWPAWARIPAGPSAALPPPAGLQA